MIQALLRMKTYRGYFSKALNKGSLSLLVGNRTQHELRILFKAVLDTGLKWKRLSLTRYLGQLDSVFGKGDNINPVKIGL